MSFEWLIDLMMEWVLSQDYQTEAQVLEWITPLNVTGVLSPNVECTYFKAGTYNNEPYYKWSNGEWYIFKGPVGIWFLNSEVGKTSGPGWFRFGADPNGVYAPTAPATGTATLAFGYKYLCNGFVNRGDPAVNDYSLIDLTTDGNWHDLDLSGIVPDGAIGVSLHIHVVATGINKSITLRENGNVNTVNTSVVNTQIAFLVNHGDGVLALDSDRKIEYSTSVGGWVVIELAVKGWWF